MHSGELLLLFPQLHSFVCDAVDRHSDVAHLPIRLYPCVCRYAAAPLVETVSYVGYHYVMPDLRSLI